MAMAERNEAQASAGYAAMSRVLDAGTPRKKSAVKPFAVVIEFHASNGQGGQWLFHVVLDESAVAIEWGPHPKPDAIVYGQDEDLASVLRGDISISQPIARGDVTFSGAYLSLIRLEKLITSARRRGA
jgi:putative sterol carrier protein